MFGKKFFSINSSLRRFTRWRLFSVRNEKKTRWCSMFDCSSSGTSFLEGRQSFEQLKQDTRDNFLTLYLADCLLFVPIQLINFKYIPSSYRVVFLSIVAFLFDAGVIAYKHRNLWNVILLQIATRLTHSARLFIKTEFRFFSFHFQISIPCRPKIYGKISHRFKSNTMTRTTRRVSAVFFVNYHQKFGKNVWLKKETHEVSFLISSGWICSVIYRPNLSLEIWVAFVNLYANLFSLLNHFGNIVTVNEFDRLIDVFQWSMSHGFIFVTISNAKDTNGNVVLNNDIPFYRFQVRTSVRLPTRYFST